MLTRFKMMNLPAPAIDEICSSTKYVKFNLYTDKFRQEDRLPLAEAAAANPQFYLAGVPCYGYGATANVLPVGQSRLADTECLAKPCAGNPTLPNSRPLRPRNP